MEKILKSRLKICTFTRKKISNKKMMVGTKVATVWVEPRDVTDCLAGVESLNKFCSLSALFGTPCCSKL